jgi:hypothetical protein
VHDPYFSETDENVVYSTSVNYDHTSDTSSEGFFYIEFTYILLFCIDHYLR